MRFLINKKRIKGGASCVADGRNRLLSIAQAAMLCNPAPCRVLFSNKKGAPRYPQNTKAQARPVPVVLCPATDQVCQENAYAGSTHRHNQSPPGERGNRAQSQPGCQETTHRRAGNAQQQVAKPGQRVDSRPSPGWRASPASAPKTSQRSSDMKIHLLCRLFCAGEWQSMRRYS